MERECARLTGQLQALCTEPRADVVQTTLGERIKIARERAGFDQGQLGDLLGVHRNTISAWEGGRTPDGDSLLRLPVLLNISADALLLGQTASLPEATLRELRAWIDRVLPPAA